MGYSCTKPLNSFPAASFFLSIPFSVQCYKQIRQPFGELIHWCSDGAFVTHNLSEIVAPIDTLDT